MILKLIAFSTGIVVGAHLFNHLKQAIQNVIQIKLVRIVSEDQMLNTQIQNALFRYQSKQNLIQNDLKLKAIFESSKTQEQIHLMILNYENVNDLKVQVQQNLQYKTLIKGISKLIINDKGSKLQQKDEEEIKSFLKSQFISENDIILLKQEEENLDQKLEQIIHSWELDLSSTIFEVMSAQEEAAVLQELSKKLSHQ